MNIGIDFDNTIIIYDEVFYKYAIQRNLITNETRKTKKEIRDTIRNLPNGEQEWIHLQAIVYGKHIIEARMADGLKNFLQLLKQKKINPFIISHKTTYPALGPRYNLRSAAKKWLEHNGFFSSDGFGFNFEKQVFFEDTLQGKLNQIERNHCNFFIDDLEEVLLHQNFPNNTKRILYSQNPSHEYNQILTFVNWNDILSYIQSLL